MHRPSGVRFLSAAVLAAVAAAALAPAANAQIMGTFSWMPPRKVEEAMQKDRVAGIYYFSVTYEVTSKSMDWNFTQPQVIDVLKKNKFACCKITSDYQGSKPWGSYQKLADEFGVGGTTTLVICSYDRQVLALVSQVIKRDEFLVELGHWAQANRNRVKASDDAANELSQAEKWIDEKKYGDAARRVKLVLDREGKISQKVTDRAKDLDGKLETIGKERLAEGKRLLDAGKPDEAKPVLEEVEKDFARFECGKEAKELLKKAGKA